MAIARGPLPSAPASPGEPLIGATSDPRVLVEAFSDGMALLPGELGDLGKRLQSASRGQDWVTAARVLRQFLEKYLVSFALSLDTPDAGANQSEELRELLRQTVGVALASLLQPLPSLADESNALAGDLKQWQPGKDLAPLARRVRELCHQVGVHAEDTIERQALILSLFDLLLENLDELLDNASWLQNQVASVRALLATRPDRQTLEATHNGLRELVYQQSLLKRGIADSKGAMQTMMVDFVERLDGMAASTGQYQSRLEVHLDAIRQARTIADLGHRLEDVLDDTAKVQEQALRSLEQMQMARADVEAAESRIRELETKLRDVSDLVATDPLTGALNRRGFEDLFDREAARAEREARPLAVAVLDLDHFRRINERHGHAGGDAVLRHLVKVIGGALRGGDVIARLGGEEFVLLFLGTALGPAAEAVVRLQRELDSTPLKLEGKSISVQFSAGVALRELGEDREHLLARADRAMYEAKRNGRNRVIKAQ